MSRKNTWQQWTVWCGGVIVLSFFGWLLLNALGVKPLWAYALIGGIVGLPWGFWGSQWVERNF